MTTKRSSSHPRRRSHSHPPPKKRPHHGTGKHTEMLYGIHPVREALTAGRRTFYEINVFEGHHNRLDIEELAETAARLKIPLKKSQAVDLRRITGSDHHQGIAAKVSPFPLSQLNDLQATIDTRKNGLFILLDTVVDPHNLGAIARSALCFGADALIIPQDRSAPPSPAASKASAGALEHTCLVQVANLVQTIKFLKQNQVWIVGLDHNSPQRLSDFDFKGSIGLVIGGEGKGIRHLVGQNCDFLLAIPQTGPVNSLNASVAGSVVMYEAYRQRSGLE